MSVIETINNKKGVSLGVAIGMIVLAAMVIAWNSRSGIPGDEKRAFYTIDDGGTYFVDDLNKVYPFEHKGKQAYRAYVFKCNGDGKKFVGYLERLNDAGQQQMAELITQPHAKAETRISQVLSGCTEVKRPHETQWVPINSAGYGDIVNVSGPDGSKDVQCLNP